MNWIQIADPKEWTLYNRSTEKHICEYWGTAARLDRLPVMPHADRRCEERRSDCQAEPKARADQKVPGDGVHFCRLRGAKGSLDLRKNRA